MSIGSFFQAVQHRMVEEMKDEISCPVNGHLAQENRLHSIAMYAANDLLGVTVTLSKSVKRIIIHPQKGLISKKKPN